MKVHHPLPNMCVCVCTALCKYSKFDRKSQKREIAFLALSSLLSIVVGSGPSPRMGVTQKYDCSDTKKLAAGFRVNECVCV